MVTWMKSDGELQSFTLQTRNFMPRFVPLPNGTFYETKDTREVLFWFLTSFVKNGEIRPSPSHKIILEQREERNQLNS